MSWVIPAVTATLTGTLLLTVVYGYIYRQYREKFLGIWTAAWTLYTLRFVFELLMQYQNQKFIIITIAQQLTNLSSGVFLLWGTNVFLGRKISPLMMFAVILDFIWIITGMFMQVSWTMLNIPTFLLTSLIYLWLGIEFLRNRDIDRLGKIFTGWGYCLWGLHRMTYPFFSQGHKLAPLGYLMAVVLEIMVATGTLLVYFQRIRKVLSDSEQRFRLLAENAQDLIYRYRLKPNPGFEYVSPSSITITGFDSEEYYKDPDFMFNLVHPDDRVKLKDLKLLVGVSREPFFLRLLRKNGKYIWTEHRNVPVHDADGNIVGFEGIARDITERKEAEEILKRYRHLSEQARDMIVFFGRDGWIIDVNEAAAKSYGYDRREFLSMNIADLQVEPNDDWIEERLREAESKAILYESRHKRKNGSVLPIEVSLQATTLDNKLVYFAIIRDITERKKAEETINHLAFHDPLTDLPNRLLFFERLNRALVNARRNQKMLAVMFLDLDRFKFVNDVMGHAMGDTLLKDVSYKLVDCVRANDTVARMGGDEFTILLPEICREEDAAVVAQKIIQALKKPWVLNGHEFHITSSIGIGLYPNDGQDAEILTKNADTAMYRAKEEGDNYQFYTPAMNQKALERMEKEQALRKALDQDELEVYYQPQVDIRDGRICGMEALLRWNHPEKGLLLPSDFISVAEDTGLIVPIGEWVLKKACTQNVTWQRLGLNPISISVNISVSQFRQRQLVDTVDLILKETGMNPRLLELEITESTAMHHVEFTIDTLQRLQDMGVRIAIDDFGTGYSSLSYLRRFPVNTLKIDRSFVRDVLIDVEDAAIVATIIVLAHNLKLKTVVEGVESEEQLRFFGQQDCFVMQGYFFSKPVRSDVAETIMRQDLYLEQKLG